jgi:hypothetical protein
MVSGRPDEVSPGVYRYYGTGSFRDRVSIGDYFVDAYDGSMSITISRCTNVTLRDFTHHSAYAYGVIGSHSRSSRFINYRLTLGPTPDGATEPRLRTANYDGMHFLNDRIGPTFENCLIENLGDDAIAIHGVFGRVLHGVGLGRTINVYSVSGGDGNFGADPGDTVFIMNRDYSYNCEAIVQSINGDDYTLDREVSAEEASLVYNVNRIGSGYVIRGCTIRNKRARGILVRGNNGVIENNIIDWTQQASIALFPEYGTWYQSGWSRNVRITGNTIRRSWSLGNTPAITITGGDVSPPAGLFRDIEVSGNTFDSCANVNLAFTSATGVRIRNNVFMNTLLDRNAAITLRNCDNVVLEGNCILADEGERALWSENVSNFTGEETGITFNCVNTIPIETGNAGSLYGKAARLQDVFVIELPAGFADVRVFNPKGRFIRTLYTGYWGGGTLRKECVLPDGTYFIRNGDGF